MLPFHATESEKRIIRELLSTAAIRGADEKITNPETWRERGVDSAAKLIAFLNRQLFPHETRIIDRRAEFLAPLQSNSVRVHFDQTLETAILTLSGKIRNVDEYRNFVERLQAFDFEAWQRHCENERSDAD